MVKFKSKKDESKNMKLIKNNLSILKEKLKWLDPFTYVDLFIMPKVKKINDSQIVETIVNILFAAIFAFLIYIILGGLFGTASPLVIVYSASMEPNLQRGDVIALRSASENDYFGPVIIIDESLESKNPVDFLTPVYENNQLSKIIFKNTKEIIPQIDASIVVYNSYPSNLPIIHRSIVKIVANDANYILTKGDNYITNPTFDQDCGRIDELRGISEKNCITFNPIKVSEIEGIAFFRAPILGCVKLWLVDDLSSIILNGRLPKDFSGIC